MYDAYIESETEYEDDPWGGLESAIFGLPVGIAVGFPVGVTLADPDDSLPWTLLAGFVPGAAGLYLMESEQAVASGLLLAYVFPPFLSLAASELWRNPSEDHRTSFGVAPTPNGGLSAVTKLRF